MKKRSPACAVLLSLLAAPARAYTVPQGQSAAHTSTAIGGRATFYKPEDASHGQWAPGAALKLHMNQAYAAELSADFTKHEVGETTVKVIPVQATILGYFYPDANVSPFLLAGIGWYYTKVFDQTPHTENRWGPHAGVGLSMNVSDRTSIDFSYRWMWSETYHINDTAHPVGQNFSGRGHMITLGLYFGL